jgi:ankyrin repeat protein
MVKSLAKKKPLSLQESDITGCFPIHTALLNGHVEIADFLLTVQGSSINSLLDASNNRPLHVAIFVRATRIVKRLVEELGSDVQDASSQATLNRAVHLAASTGSVELLKYFTEEMPETANSRRATLLDTNMQGMSPIFRTVEGDYLDAFKFILEHQPDSALITGSEQIPLFWCAVSAGATRIVEYMIERRMDEKVWIKDGADIVVQSARCGCFELLQWLHSKGYDFKNSLRRDGLETPLIMAASFGKPDLARFLVDCGVNPDAEDFEGKTALMVACYEGNLEMVKFLCSIRPREVQEDEVKRNYAAPSTHQGTLLYLATDTHRLDIIEWLIDSGTCDVNFVDEMGLTVLMDAARANFEIEVRLLISKGADHTIVNPGMYPTAFMSAVATGSLDAAKAIYEADPDVVKEKMWLPGLNGPGSALFAAIASGHLEMACWLVEVDPNKDLLKENDGKKDFNWPNDGLDSLQPVWPWYTPLAPGNADKMSKDEMKPWMEPNPHILASINWLVGTKNLERAASGNLVLSWLFSLGLNVEAHSAVLDSHGNAPIHNAIHAWNNEAVKTLVEKGNADLSRRDSDFRLPLEIAAGRGNMTLVPYIVDQMRERCPKVDLNEISEQDSNPLISAILEGRGDVVRYLIDLCDMNPLNPDFPLAIDEMAAIGGSVEAFKFFVSRKVISHSTPHKRPPIFHALARGHSDMVIYLLDEFGSSFDEFNCHDNPWFRLVLGEISSPALLEMLYLRGHSLTSSAPDGGCYNVMHAACEFGKLEIAKWAKGLGISFSKKDDHGDSPFIHACRSGRRDIIEWLLKSGASPFESSALDGMTPADILDAHEAVDLLDSFRRWGIIQEEHF